MRYSRVVIILLRSDLYKPAFSIYSFVKLGFRLSVFWFLYLWFLVFLLYVLSSMPPHSTLQYLYNQGVLSIMCSLILVSLYTNGLLRYMNRVIKNMLEERF